MREFVDWNGETFTHPAGGLHETASVIEDLAASLMPESGFITW